MVITVRAHCNLFETALIQTSMFEVIYYMKLFVSYSSSTVYGPHNSIQGKCVSYTMHIGILCMQFIYTDRMGLHSYINLLVLAGVDEVSAINIIALADINNVHKIGIIVLGEGDKMCITGRNIIPSVVKGFKAGIIATDYVDKMCTMEKYL